MGNNRSGDPKIGQRWLVPLSWKCNRLKRCISDKNYAYNGEPWSMGHHGRAPCGPPSQLLCGDVGSVFLWLLHRSSKGQWENKEEQKIVQKNILEDACLPQGILSGPAESHRLSGITQYLKESLTAICAIMKS